MNKKTNLKVLAIASLFIALDIILTRFFSVTFFNVERISLQFLATSLCAAILGPWWGMASAATADILGVLINSSGAPYFPGFTITCALRGLVYGLGLHKKELTYKRVLLTEVIVSFLLNLLLNSLWLSVLFGKGYLGLLALKLPVRIFWAPLAASITFVCLKSLKKLKI